MRWYFNSKRWTLFFRSKLVSNGSLKIREEMDRKVSSTKLGGVAAVADPRSISGRKRRAADVSSDESLTRTLAGIFRFVLLMDGWKHP
jgi:hypothetical protein